MLALVVMLAACQSGGPLRSFTQGEQLAFYDFSETGTFEEGSYGSGAVSLQIADGVYRISVREGDNELWWGQWGDTYSDVIIDADVEQTSERNENAYGLMCRVRGTVGQEQEADPTLAAIVEGEQSTQEAVDAEDATPEAEIETTATESATEATAQATEEGTAEVRAEPRFGEGDGYLFLIQGAGQVGIFRSNGRQLTPLVDWKASSAVVQGRAENRLRAVCVGDYLALFVNDQLVAEAIDDRYTEGQAGMVASAASRLGLRVEFDNLMVSAGS